jgi:predicted site-specific integrase-resolvase
MQDFLKTADVADALGISRARVHQMVELGMLAPVYRDKRYFLFARKDVETLVQSRNQNK